jgi:hypothetical protein
MLPTVYSEALARYSTLRTSGHWQDAARQSSRDFVLAELLLRQGPRAAQHVHRRVRGERSTRLPARTRCTALRRLLRRARLRRAQARRARRLGRRDGPHRLAATRRARRHRVLLVLRRRLRHRRDEPPRPARPRPPAPRPLRPHALPRRQRYAPRAA